MQNSSTALDLPEDFTFSQSNLQTYVDCPRRFWLTYIQRLPWPAVQAGPVQEHEYMMRLGEAFHRAIQRTESGIPAELVKAQLEPPLDVWFADYETYRPADLPREWVESEAVLALPLTIGDAGPKVALAGKFDLLAIEPHRRGIIVDWKTNRKRTAPATLRTAAPVTDLPVPAGRSRSEYALGAAVAKPGGDALLVHSRARRAHTPPL